MVAVEFLHHPRGCCLHDAHRLSLTATADLNRVDVSCCCNHYVVKHHTTNAAWIGVSTRLSTVDAAIMPPSCRHHATIASGGTVACAAGGCVGTGNRPRSGIHRASALHALASRALRGAHLQHKGGPVTGELCLTQSHLAGYLFCHSFSFMHCPTAPLVYTIKTTTCRLPACVDICPTSSPLSTLHVLTVWSSQPALKYWPLGLKLAS